MDRPQEISTADNGGEVCEEEDDIGRSQLH